jgi:hypothetical protein
MIYPDVPVEKWCEKYDLHIAKDRCTNCSRIRITNIPFIESGFAGLMSTQCECGMSGDSFTVNVPLNNQFSSLLFI